MKINKIIKERRLANGWTQQQIADYLGVSAPAVNKWEKGLAYPDITTLPALARLLGTDLNTLLSFKEDLSEQEIAAFINEVAEDVLANGIEHGYELAMGKLNEYPGCDRLALALAQILDGAVVMYTDADAETIERYHKRTEQLYYRVADSKDSLLADAARAVLATNCMTRAEYDRAEALLAELPDEPAYNKKQQQASLLIKKGRLDEAAKLAEGMMLAETNKLNSIFATLISIALLQGRKGDARQIADIAQEAAMLFGLSEYTGYVAHFHLAEAQKDAATAIAIYKKLLPALVDMRQWRLADSPLYRNTESKSGDNSLAEALLPRIISELENTDDPETAYLREAPGYASLIEFAKQLQAQL